MTSLDPTLAALVRAQTGVTWSRARALCAEGRVSIDGQPCLDPAVRVPPGAVVTVDRAARKIRARALSENAIVHFDRDIVVVDKPAGMLSVADVTGNRNTLADHLRTLLRSLDSHGPDAPLGVVHRLDKDTSGVMVFARTTPAKRILAAQFRAHDVQRIYHALAHGTVAEAHVESYLARDRGDGLRGSLPALRGGQAVDEAAAKRAVTQIRPIAQLSGATLVECSLETGRQHQIRIHLAELGHPLLGERVYIRDLAGERIDAPRTMLHAHTLGLMHPRTGQSMIFRRDAPEDFRSMIEALS